MFWWNFKTSFFWGVCVGGWGVDGTTEKEQSIKFIAGVLIPPFLWLASQSLARSKLCFLKK